MNIPIARPATGPEEAEAASRPLMSGWVTQGPEVKAFEEEFAAMTGADFACAVSSGTTALHLALLAVGVQPGDEVITVSHSFIATANSIRYCQAIPVFIDIRPGTFNIDPAGVAQAITEKTRAILCVHQMGMPCDLAAILEIAKTHSLPVVEDAACAAGSEYFFQSQWQKIGRPHGNVACFSFHPRKVITTGDGGMITTNDPKIDAECKLLRQHAMSTAPAERHGAGQIANPEYPKLGFNYRMTDIQAAVGREQLKKLPDIVARRRELADMYRQELADCPAVILPEEPEWAKSNWQSFCIRLTEEKEVQAVMLAMQEAGVSTRGGIMCAHREEAYAREPWLCLQDNRVVKGNSKNCPGLIQSELAQDNCISLPIFPQMTDEELKYVAGSLKKILVC